MMSAVIDGIPLLVVIAGLVEFAKRLGLKGDACLALSVGLGAILGGGYWIYTNGVPTTFAGWFTLVVYGAAMGLTTSGLYDLGKRYAR